MDYGDWVKLSDPEKIDSLREELLGIKRLIQYGIAFAGAVGTVFGSISTMIFEHLMRQ